jgi:hypothetical protein
MVFGYKEKKNILNAERKSIIFLKEKKFLPFILFLPQKDISLQPKERMFTYKPRRLCVNNSFYSRARPS